MTFHNVWDMLEWEYPERVQSWIRDKGTHYAVTVQLKGKKYERFIVEKWGEK
jgi:hypothetical protein